MKPVKCKACGFQIRMRSLDCPRCKADSRKVSRELFGKLALVSFWGFNAWMAFQHISFWVTQPSIFDQNIKGARLAEVVGADLAGSGEIIVFWLLGCLFLGTWMLLSRPD